MHLKSKLCNTDCRKWSNLSKSIEVFLTGSLIKAGTHVNSFFRSIGIRDTFITLLFILVPHRNRHTL